MSQPTETNVAGSENLFNTEDLIQTDEIPETEEEILATEENDEGEIVEHNWISVCLLDIETDIPEDETEVTEDLMETNTEETETDITAPKAKKPINLNRISELPLSKVKHIIKLDPDVNLVNAEAVFLITKATEFFVKSLGKESFNFATQQKKKTITKQHVDQALTMLPIELL